MEPVRRKIGPLGWIALFFSSLSLLAAGVLVLLVLTAEKPPPKVIEEPVSDPLLIAQEADDRFFLPLEKATLEGKDLAIEERAVGKVIGGWKSAEDRISWRLKLKKEGIYEIHLTYSNARGQGEAAGKYRLKCGQEEIVASARPSGGGDKAVSDKVFLKLAPAGEVTLELSAAANPGGEFLAVKEVTLVPRLRQRRKE